MSIAIFPGSFDPFTKGHELIVHKALHVFDEIIISIGINSKKNYFFENSKRINHIRALFKDNSKVHIEKYYGLTVDFCKEKNSKHIIRGLRNSMDFEFENSIALMNKDMSDIETIFFLTDKEFAHINSSIVREIFLNNGDISAYVTQPNLLV